MNTALFEDEKEWEAFEKEAMSWIGTPFRHATNVKGRGVDCSLLVGSIYKDLGIITKLAYDFYNADWYISGQNELILEYMEKHICQYLSSDLYVEKVKRPFFRGDVLTLMIAHNNLNNHAVIYMGDNKILHAMSFGKVEVRDFPKTWENKTGTIFRLFKR